MVASCFWNMLGNGPAGDGMWSLRSWTAGRPAPCSWCPGWGAGLPGSATLSPIRSCGCRPASARPGPPWPVSWGPRRRENSGPVRGGSPQSVAAIPTGAGGGQWSDGGRGGDRPARRGVTAGIRRTRLKEPPDCTFVLLSAHACSGGSDRSGVDPGKRDATDGRTRLGRCVDSRYRRGRRGLLVVGRPPLRHEGPASRGRRCPGDGGLRPAARTTRRHRRAGPGVHVDSRPRSTTRSAPTVRCSRTCGDC